VLAVVGVAGVLLFKAFAGLDTGATWRALTEAGRWAPLAFVPFVAAMTFDATGIGILLGTLGRRVRLARLLPIRIATEALHLTAPAGFVVADSATAALLDSRCQVPVDEGAVLAIARKWLVMRAHGAYIALGAAGGATLLAGVSSRSLGGPWLPWAVGASGLLPLTLSLLLGAGFRGRPALARIQAALGRLPIRAVRQRVARWQTGAARVDAKLARVGAARRETWIACASFFGGWICETLETALIVKLVGGPLDLPFAMGVEVGISMLRSVGNVAPAGLGVQDAGYAVLFEAVGLPPHTTAAFVLLKRAKELVWIAFGYGLLITMRRTKGVPALSGGLVGRVARSAPVRTILGQAGGASPNQPAA
jgi:hypothetical protein